MGYFKQTVISISWVSAFRIANRILSIVRTAILARLLTPLQFGDYGIAVMVLGLVEIFTETGINVFFVQQDDDNAISNYIDTAWVISIIRGVAITAIVLISSVPVSIFFNDPAAKNLILIMALVPFIRGFINPAEAKFQKHLRFHQEFFLRTLVTLADAAAALSIAYLYRTPMGLVCGLIAGAAVEVVVSQLLIHPRPKFAFDASKGKEIVSSGKWITSAGVASYFATKGVDMSIGKLLSTQSLGIFQMAYRFSILFVDELVEMTNRVAFPVYMKIGGDRARLQTAFLKMYVSFILTVGALMTLVALFAKPIVAILLGPTWADTTIYLQLLSMVGFALALANTTNPLFLAVKKQNYLSHSVFCQLIVFVLLMIPTLQTPSLERIILAFLGSIIASLPLRTYYAIKIFSKKN